MRPFSKIIAGTMTWGTWGKNFTSAEMSALIEDIPKTQRAFH